MRLKLFIIIGVILINAACKVKEDLCSEVNCEAAVVLRFKFTDINNNDLLFSSNPAYGISDLKITSSLHTQNVPFNIDSSNKNNKYIKVTLTASQTLLLKLAHHTPDSIKLNTSLKEAGCCGRLEINKIMINQTTVCTNCVTTEPLTFIK